MLFHPINYISVLGSNVHIRFTSFSTHKTMKFCFSCEQTIHYFTEENGFLSTSHLREMPCLLLNVGNLVTVEELRKGADLIVHHTASVLPGAAQRAQE